MKTVSNKNDSSKIIVQKYALLINNAIFDQMKFIGITLLFALITGSLHAQLSDAFNDGNLMNPDWQGDLTHFEVDAQQRLHQVAPAAGTSKLFTTLPVLLGDTLIWEMWVNLDFSPSASNYCEIIYAASNNDLTTNQAYFLRIGENGSNDAIRFFFRNSSGVETEIANGQLAALGGATAIARIRIQRIGNGDWKAWMDYTGGNGWTDSITWSHFALLPVDMKFFGVKNTYTDTRKDKFYFDDIYVGGLNQDNAPPVLLSCTMISIDTAILVWSEKVNSVIAKEKSLYSIQPPEFSVTDITVSNIDYSVRLLIEPNLQTGVTYPLTVQLQQDFAGNTSPPQVCNLLWDPVIPWKVGDLIVSEMMADPDPIVGLPNAEWLEIYNTTTHAIDLNDWKLIVNTTLYSLPPIILSPQNYIIITSAAQVANFTNYGQVGATDKSLSLNNTGFNIQIQAPDQTTIFQSIYNPNYHTSTAKKDGGWSVECSNPLKTCDTTGLWHSSLDPSGGTPGKINSIWMPIADQEGPMITNVFCINDTLLRIQFQENLDVTGIQVTQFDVQGLIPDSYLLLSPSSVQLHFTTSVNTGAVPMLEYDGGIQDCLGNISVPQSVPISCAYTSQPGDLIINEILFNPFTGGADFIEILNVSGKPLFAVHLGLSDAVSSIDFEGPGVIAPEAYIVFTDNKNDISQRYTVPHPEWCYERDIPSWNDDGDQVILYRLDIGGGKIILDSFTYDANWHNALLRSKEGISLERVSSTFPSTSPYNWHSAASTSGFATPTGPNSQRLHPGNQKGGGVSLEKSVISPDQDGRDDYLNIHYQLNEPGWFARSVVYDIQGAKRMTLEQVDLVGTDGIYSWDGADPITHARIPMGVYLMFIELVHPQLGTQSYKLPFTVAQAF